MNVSTIWVLRIDVMKKRLCIDRVRKMWVDQVGMGFNVNILTLPASSFDVLGSIDEYIGLIDADVVWRMKEIGVISFVRKEKKKMVDDCCTFHCCICRVGIAPSTINHNIILSITNVRPRTSEVANHVE